MNVFLRKMCILKQLKNGFSSDGRFLSGVVKTEFYGGTLRVEVSLINFAPLSAGNYCLVIADRRGEAVSFPVAEDGGSFSSSGKVDISDGFLAVICYVDSTDYAAVAMGVNGDNVYETGALLLKLFGMKKNFAPAPVPPKPYYTDSADKRSCFAEPELPKTQPAETDQKERGIAPPPNVDKNGDKNVEKDGRESGGLFKALAENYDDERVSDENYYGFSSAGGEEDNLESQSLLRLFKISCGDTYYKSVRSQLDEVFRSSPRDETLCRIFPHSVWARCRTGELIGVITEKMVVRYICCAVRADGREKKRVTKGGCYVPVSCFNGTERYYISFQDADTGEYVSVEDE